MRIIPKKTKVKVEFYRNFTLADVLIGLLGLSIEFLILLTDYGLLTYIFMTVVLGIFIAFAIIFAVVMTLLMNALGEKWFLKIEY